MYMNIEKNSWLSSCESYQVYKKDGNKYLTAYLYDRKGNNVKNKIRLHPLLENYSLNNINGILTYNLTREEDDYMMNELFPIYSGEKINRIQIKECVMLSVNNKKYNELRNETINILNQYNIPNLFIYFGFTRQTFWKSKFADCMNNKNIRNELSCGMLTTQQSKDQRLAAVSVNVYILWINVVSNYMTP